MILTFLLSGSYMTMKMAHGLRWGPLVLPPLSGETCWVCDRVAEGEGRGEGELGRWGSGVEAESGEISGPVGELGRRGLAGWRVGRGSNSGLRLVEEEPFCLRGKMQRRTLWVEQALHREGLLQRAQKAWA